MEKSQPTAIVVGGSSGIGFETCAKLTALGWKVFNISRTPCKIRKVKNFAADVVKEGELSEAIRTIGKKSRVDLLVYSAGFSMAAPLEFAKESDYRYLFDVNFFGALKAMQAAIPLMKEKGGKIILVGSLGGTVPIVYDAFYSASKAALEMLAREAYLELKPYRIQVTAFLPGGTATAFTFKRKVYSKEESRSYAENLDRAVTALAGIEQGGMSPSEVAEDILSVVLSDRPPVVRASGFKNSATRMISRFAPEKMTLYFNERMFGQ